MSNSHYSSEVSAPNAIASFATRAVTKLATLITAWQNRRAFYAMGALSDRELSDIGLTRADLLAVAAGPLSVDPTARLSALVRGKGEIRAARVG